jgi:hypothetical protein
MPQTFGSAVGQLGMDGTLAKVIQTTMGSSKPNIVALTALTGAFGTTGNAIVDATSTFSQSITNNNNRALEDKINAIIAALQA